MEEVDIMEDRTVIEAEDNVAPNVEEIGEVDMVPVI